jgi:hypothetical protein
MVSGSSRLGKQLEEVIATLDRVGARFALIGGLALAPHKVIRATQDIDLLIDADLGDAVDQALTSLGYRCLHRSADAAICAAINASISCMRTGRTLFIRRTASGRKRIRRIALGDAPNLHHGASARLLSVVDVPVVNRLTSSDLPRPALPIAASVAGDIVSVPLTNVIA